MRNQYKAPVMAGLTLCLLAQAAMAAPVPSDKAASSVTMGDRRWVINAAKGGAEEVRLGNLAAGKGSSKAVKDFGKQMVVDHGKAGAKLKMLADKKGIRLAPSDSKADADFKRLSGLSGRAFDKAYVDLMVKNHKADAASFDSEYRRGGDANIKAFAGEVLPVVKHHLTMIQQMQSSMK